MVAVCEIHSCGDNAVEIVFKLSKPDKNELCLKKEKNVPKYKEPYIKLPDGNLLHGTMTTMKAIARTTKCDILGKDALEEAEVQQWMEYCLTKIDASQNDKSEMKEIIKLLNTFLVDKVYFVGYSLTLADLLIFSMLFNVYENLTYEEKEKVINVSRWFNEVQNVLCASDKRRGKVAFVRNLLY
ncbi:eukaryotic translation elongation factor 1 epsilon-1-like [Xenia sp. Carnegie-2017]|uniref:eukaryotic translation elongation factor 1 epsilon-1-like n=1 Tax=Xenia sp. Carnegie-2017 TaxID=2897299 RepID=UPI001F0342C7|nr:eukaryotic translation elongation factor 1 epsilon-1-like [Xenia sp. Carnegie-2017]